MDEMMCSSKETVSLIEWLIGPLMPGDGLRLCLFVGLWAGLIYLARKLYQVA